MSKTLKVTVAKNGEVTIEADGFVGPWCESIVNELVKHQGKGCKEVHQEHKPEYYLPCVNGDNSVKAFN